MIQEKLYLLEVHVSQCQVSIQEKGQFSLFLRIGKITSSIIKAKSYDGKLMIFDSIIRCNCDQGAIDTKRFSITLNINMQNKKNRDLGIVMIPLESDVIQQFCSFKIAQCSDSDATIQLKYAVKLIGGNYDINKKGSGLKYSLSSKKPEENPKSNKQLEIVSIKTSDNNKQKRNFFSDFFPPPSVLRISTSQFVEDLKNLEKLEFESQGDQIVKLKESNSQLMKQNQILKRQKDFLKQIIKLEYRKNKILQQFLQKSNKKFAEVAFKPGFQKKKIKKSIKDQIPIQEHVIEEPTQNISNIRSSIRQNPTCMPLTQIIKRSSHEIGKNDLKLTSESKITFQKITPIYENLQNMLKYSITKERESFKNDIQNLRKAILDQSNFHHERKLRSVKIKVQKSYLELLKQPQPYTKERIIKQKIDFNKILDELLICSILP